MIKRLGLRRISRRELSTPGTEHCRLHVDEVESRQEGKEKDYLAPMYAHGFRQRGIKLYDGIRR